MKITKGKALKIFAVLLDVLAPLIATLTQFPVWVARSSEATMSGMFIILALISCIPFLKQIKEYFKSPAAWAVWLVIFVVFILINNIIDEMIAVSFVGLVANLIGTVIYKAGEILENKESKSVKEEKNDGTN